MEPAAILTNSEWLMSFVKVFFKSSDLQLWLVYYVLCDFTKTFLLRRACHLFAEGATVAEDHVVWAGSSKADPQLIMADSIPPDIEFKVDDGQSNDLWSLSCQTPAAASVAEVLVRVVWTSYEACVSTGLGRHVSCKRPLVVRTTALDVRYCTTQTIANNLHRGLGSTSGSAYIGLTIGRLWVRCLPRSVFHSWQVTAWGKLSAVAGHHSFFRAVGSWSLDCQRLMDSDLAWVNGKSAIDKADAMLMLSSAL